MRTVVVSILLVLSASLAVADDPLEEIAGLARAGAPGLALLLLDDHQHGAAGDEWVAAERERLHILATRGEWRRIVDRYDALPEGLPGTFLEWRELRQAEALLQLDEGRAALELLRRQLWRAAPGDEATRRHLRVLVLRAFLAADDLESALIAMRRFHQDYGREDEALRALHGEALLRAGRAEEAYSVLGESSAPTMLALQWLARLRVDPASAGEVMEWAVRAGSARDGDERARVAAWRVAAEAAARIGNRAARVSALERALVMSTPTMEPLPEVLRTSPAQLWQSYLDWGRALGNAEQLIIGLDQQWVDAADARLADEPGEARALYAALAESTRAPAIVQFAHFRFAQSLMERQGGEQLLAALYLEGGIFDRPESIPPPIRYVLVDEVLRRNEIELASRLVADLERPPPDVDPAEWAMRRARVLVLAGRPDDAFRVLDGLLAQQSTFDLDRFLQVLFDMQSADAHEYALELFALVVDREGVAPQQRRELLFWMADSYRALGSHAQAARLYLRSATLLEPYAMDPWAQTARFQAAESLARAGLREDAIVLLQSLLNATDDPGRRAVLRHQIEQYRR